MEGFRLCSMPFPNSARRHRSPTVGRTENVRSLTHFERRDRTPLEDPSTHIDTMFGGLSNRDAGEVPFSSRDLEPQW